MGVTVRTRGQDPRLAVKFKKTDFQNLGYLIRDIIIERTERGVDGMNKPFKPYSSQYAKRRLKEGFDTSPVNLQVSGAMLNGIKVDATDTGVVVYY